MDNEALCRRLDAMDARLVTLDTRTERIDKRTESLDVMAEQAKRAEAKADQADRLLRGSDGQNGALSRIRILEEDRANRTWWERAIAGTAIGSLATAIGAWLRS